MDNNQFRTMAIAGMETHFTSCAMIYRERPNTDAFVAMEDAMWALQWIKYANATDIVELLADVGVGHWPQTIRKHAQRART